VQESPIWILIANERTSAIYVRREGAYQLLQTASFPPKAGTMTCEEIESPRKLHRWTKREFAMEIMAELQRSAVASDSLIIVADPEMIAELVKLETPAVRKLLVAEISDPASADVDLPLAKLYSLSEFMQRRNAVR